MSQGILKALARIEHDLQMDVARARLGIPVDWQAHERLLTRRTALETERDAQRQDGASALERFSETQEPTAQGTPVLTPMGMDETLSECERRAHCGKPPRTLPKYL